MHLTLTRLELARNFLKFILFLSLLRTFSGIDNIYFSMSFTRRHFFYIGGITHLVRTQTNISDPKIRIRACAYKGLRNASCLGKFAYLLFRKYFRKCEFTGMF